MHLLPRTKTDQIRCEDRLQFFLNHAAVPGVGHAGYQYVVPVKPVSVEIFVLYVAMGNRFPFNPVFLVDVSYSEEFWANVWVLARGCCVALLGFIG